MAVAGILLLIAQPGAGAAGEAALPRPSAAGDGHRPVSAEGSTIPLPVGDVAVLRAEIGGRGAAGVGLRYRLEGGEEAWVSAKTDEAGRLRVTGVSEERPLQVETDDSAIAFASAVWPPGEHLWQLEAGSVLAVRAVDAAGRPLAGVEASVLRPVAYDSSIRRRLKASSDAAGSVRLAGLAEGKHSIQLRRDGYVPETRWLGTGQESVTVELQPARTVALRVQVEGGQVLAGVVLRDGSTGLQWTSDDRGQVLLQEAPRGATVTLNVSLDGYLPQEVSIPPAVEQLSVILATGAGVRFRLLDEASGAHIRRAGVEIRNGGQLHFEPLEASGDEFTLQGLEPGPLELKILADGFRPYSIAADLNRDWIDLGTLPLDGGAAVRGILLSKETAEPLVGAKVSHIPFHPWGSLAAELLEQRLSTATDAQGEFLLRGLEEGKRCLLFEHPLIPPAAEFVEDLVTRQIQELGARFLGDPYAVTGRLRPDSPMDLGEIEVELRVGALRSPCLRVGVRADEDGRFVFPRVAEGTYQLVALRQRQILAVQELQVTGKARRISTTLDIESRQITGRLTLNGVPATGGIVELATAGTPMGFEPPTLFLQQRGPGAGSRPQVMTDMNPRLAASVSEQGTFIASGRLPGRLIRATFRPPDSPESLSAELTLPESDADVDLRFDGEPVSGWVLDEEGDPLAGAWLALEAGGRLLRRTQSGADGTFLFSYVPQGEHRLSGTLGEAKGQIVLEAAADRRDGIELRLTEKRSAEVAIALVDEDRQPAAGALVGLISSAGHQRLQAADAQGLVRLSGLESGTYKLIYRTSRGVLGQGPELPVAVGQSLKVDLATGPPVTGEALKVGAAAAGYPAALLTADGYPVGAFLDLAKDGLWVDPEGVLPLPPVEAGDWQILLAEESVPRRVRVRD